MQTVEARASFIDVLATFERVQEVTIKLRPTNPHYSEIHRTVDQRLKELRAKQYKEVITAGREGPGLAATDDEDIRRKAAMAEDGYGEASATGTKDGRPARASTRQNPVSAQAETRDRSPSEIFSKRSLGWFP